jgi:hypothetical protein
MVDEKEEQYDEEGEYHFSDDQVNYDIEPEAPKGAPSSVTKESFLTKFSQYRRGILGAISLVVLIGVVYKILAPTSNTPATDFSQATPAVTKVAKPAAPKTPAAPVATPPATQTAAQMPASTATPQTANGPSVDTTVAAASPAQPAVTPSSATFLPAQPTVVQAPVTQTSSEPNSQTKNILDRLTMLEQQNTAMMNLLQTEYAQKIADYETQSNATRGKMEEITKRVNRIETSLNQINELLQGMSKSQASGMMGNMPSTPGAEARSTEPKAIYSVQAIIPGRAWLKSESGDTVTVAEGDYLKNYGRITKIDPYDGIVDIDTGKRVITLTYGVGSD